MVQKLMKELKMVQQFSSNIFRFIFEGPSMVRKINEEILELMAKDGFENILTSYWS